MLSLFALICLVGGIRVTGQANSTSAGNAAQANAATQSQVADNRWATTPVTTIFPATLTAAVSGIVWDRVAINSSTSCSSALTADWQPNSNRPCTAVLRATYTDQARTIAATVGVIVNPSSTDPAGASMYGTWLSPITDAQDQSEGIGAAQTKVDFVIHALAAPGTRAGRGQGYERPRTPWVGAVCRPSHRASLPVTCYFRMPADGRYGAAAGRCLARAKPTWR